MFGSTVTVFSKKGDVFYPRVFHDTQVARDRGYLQRVYGETASESVAVHVKKINGLAENVYTVYEPKAWAALQDVTNAVSFKDGDVLWLGDWSMVDRYLEPINDTDYPAGFYNDLRKTYDCTYTITKTATFGTLPHWEIAGQ